MPHRTQVRTVVTNRNSTEAGVGLCAAGSRLEVARYLAGRAQCQRRSGLKLSCWVASNPPSWDHTEQTCRHTSRCKTATTSVAELARRQVLQRSCLSPLNGYPPSIQPLTLSLLLSKRQVTFRRRSGRSRGTKREVTGPKRETAGDQTGDHGRSSGRSRENKREVTGGHGRTKSLLSLSLTHSLSLTLTLSHTLSHSFLINSWKSPCEMFAVVFKFTVL